MAPLLALVLVALVGLPLDYTPTRMKVSKSCVTSCFETVYDGYSKHASTTACCQYDLCNGAGLAVPGTLALAPILLATFWGLL
ncbi:Ly6/neurotoxin 1 [Phyllostomus discolor]|uniref:Ly6/neurotoxin 1 n=1 Tax=Phyllostomus discolor TaxID=89673 RepID=A0A833ZWJ5_9CHIR|nr:Ly6/neurotoxin 1 [Phyllostomus discolor]